MRCLRQPTPTHFSGRVSPKVGSSLLDPSVFDGLEGEWLYKLEAAEHAIRYIIGRAEYWEQELEREDKTADSAYDLAVRAIDEFSDFNRHFFDVVAYEIGREIENGNAPELVDAYFSLEETFIERISRTQRLLLDYAKGLAKTEDQRDDLVRRREIANDNVNRERRSA